MVSRYLTPSEKRCAIMTFSACWSRKRRDERCNKDKRPTGKDLLIIFGFVTGSICVTVWIVWVAIDYAVRSLFGQ